MVEQRQIAQKEKEDLQAKLEEESASQSRKRKIDNLESKK
jgi:hypothetical protein